MAIAIPSSIYKPTSGRFTVFGTKYMRWYFSETPKPTDDQLEELEKATGCSVRKLKVSKIVL
jgi:hypothetical protein